MEQERQLARAEGRPDPINDSFESTSRMYELVMERSLRAVAERPRGAVHVMLATHNEQSVRQALLKCAAPPDAYSCLHCSLRYMRLQVLFAPLLSVKDGAAEAHERSAHHVRSALWHVRLPDVPARRRRLRHFQVTLTISIA